LIINIGEIDAAKVALGPDIHPHDGKLDLMIMSSASLLGAVRLGLHILTRRFDDTKGLRYMSASRIRVSARPPLPTQLDGEQNTWAVAPDGRIYQGSVESNQQSNPAAFRPLGPITDLTAADIEPLGSGPYDDRDIDQANRRTLH
jgi:hypothetical protein